MRALAREIGVSPSLLSQIENGLARPSVGTLWALISTLGVSMDGLFAAHAPPVSPEEADPAGTERTILHRAADARSLDLGGGVTWQQLASTPKGTVVFADVTYVPGGNGGEPHPHATHSGREYGVVISGRLSIEVGDESFELGPGDSITFPSAIPHRFRALGEQPARGIWINLG